MWRGGGSGRDVKSNGSIQLQFYGAAQYRHQKSQDAKTLVDNENSGCISVVVISFRKIAKKQANERKIIRL